MSGFRISRYDGVPLVSRVLFRDCADRRRHGGLVRWHPDAYEPCPTCARRARRRKTFDNGLSKVYLFDLEKMQKRLRLRPPLRGPYR